MKLVSLESKEEMDSISGYMKTNREKYFTNSIVNFRHGKFLELKHVLTSLKKFGNNDFRWHGTVPTDSVRWATGQPSSSFECAAFGSTGFFTVACDSAINFACEKEGHVSTTSLKIPTNQGI
jgi:hypothetical protein